MSEGFRAQAASLVGGSEVLELAAHLDPALADRAARDHALRGDVSGYAALAAKATDHVVRNAQSIEAADGLTVQKLRDEWVVSGLDSVPGGQITVRQAVRLGLISVTVAR